MNGYYTKEELLELGFSSVGEDVYVSRKASIYGAAKMKIGSHVRIDDFALLIGNVEIHDYVHIGAYCGLHASQDGKIIFEDYSGISSNVTIYASSDSFSGEYITGRPGLPDECMDVICETVRLGKYSQIGTGSTVIPGGSLGEGTAVGAMSLINKKLDDWKIYCGIPCRCVKERSKQMLTRLPQHEEEK